MDRCGTDLGVSDGFAGDAHEGKRRRTVLTLLFLSRNTAFSMYLGSASLVQTLLGAPAVVGPTRQLGESEDAAHKNT